MIELDRYHRQIILPGVGRAGQEQLAQARVLVIGMGGLGSPIALYLAAAGVGTLGIADMDAVERSNLHRQILHTDADVGRSKLDSARQSLRAIQPNINLIEFPDGIQPDNALERLRQFDVIVDGCDNFPTRYLNNDAASLAGKPLVYGSIFQFEGQVTVFDPRRGGPCYRCLFPELPAPGSVPNCAEAGVFGALCGIVGSWQAAEALKLILGIGSPLIGKLKVLDILSGRDRLVAIKRDPACPLCGTAPRITGIAAKNYQMRCDLATDAKPEIMDMEITAEAAAAALNEDNPPLLLDVREPDEQAFCSIGEGLFIPTGQIVQDWHQVPRDRPVIVYCHHGMRSMRVVQFLQQRGFDNVTSLRGGIDAWSRLIDPSVPRY